MGFRVADVVGLVWSHPIVTFGVLLFFTPPLFPVVVYFSPLLISTALVVLAMISMGSDAEEPSRFSIDSQYKRGWIDEDARIDGPFLEGERISKRLKASSKDESWFGKVKNWEGTGRAWVESVLSQESRRVVPSLVTDDGNAAVKDEMPPPLETTKDVTSDNGKPHTEGIPESFESRDIPLDRTVDNAESDAPVTKPEIAPVVVPEIATSTEPEFADDARIPVDEANDFIEITPASESKHDLLTHVVIAPRSIVPPLPLLKSRSLSTSSSIDSSAKNGLAAQNLSVAKGIKLPIIKDLLGFGAKPLPASEGVSLSKMITDGNPGGKDNLTSQVSGYSSGASHHEILGAAPTVNDGVHLSIASNVETQKKNESMPEELKSVSANVSKSGLGPNLPPAGKDDGNPRVLEVTKAPEPREVKSAAELLAPLRQGSAYGLGTPSAAVALSEKLKVPLEDIMSLLAGDDKETLPDEEPVGKGSSSETTTSQDEEWSSSDEESPAPFKPTVAQTTEKKEL